MPSIKDYLSVEDMYPLKTVQDLKSRLSELGVRHKSKDLKCRLQALLALTNLGLAGPDLAPDAALLDQVEGFCKILVREQLDELSKRNLDVEGNKWDHVEVFIRSIASDASANFAELAIHDSSLDRPSVPLVDLAVVNLLLTSIYAETARTKSTTLLPNSPVDGATQSARAKAVHQHLRNLPAFGIPQHLEAALKLGSEPGHLLSWICSKYGPNYIPATGDLLIPSMPKGVHQFILARPCTKLHTSFEKRINKFSPRKSIVLWHGTNMRFLRSIIINGFIPAYDTKFGSGVFMAESPRTSNYYAFSRRFHYYDKFHIGYDGTPKLNLVWKNSPFQDHGVLLGCEVAGKGRLTNDQDHVGDKVHVLTDLSSAMIRYIFLLPPKGYGDGRNNLLPRPSVVNPEMMAAFELLRERFYHPQAEHYS